VGLSLLVLVGLLFHWTPWDLQVATYYWDQGHGSWPEAQHPLVGLLYRFGTYPALLAGLIGGVVWFFGDRVASLRPWRGPGLFLFLLLLLGPGLLVNGLGKALAGRPRPSDVLGLGGGWPFSPLGSLGTPGRGQSFPSGHASMGFYWLSLFFLWPRRRWTGLALGLLFGGLMSWTRIVQGGHFLSDTLFAGALVFSLAAALSPLIQWQPRPAFWRQKQVLQVLALGAIAYLSIAQVVYEERDFLWTRDPKAQAAFASQRLSLWQGAAPLNKIAVDLSLERGDLNLGFGAKAAGAALPLALEERFSGQGFPGAKDSVSVLALPASPLFEQGPGTLGALIVQKLKGAWWSVKGAYDLKVPQDLLLDLRLKTAHGVLTIGSLPAGRQVVLFGQFRQEQLPAGFLPHDQSAWLREGAQPQIALTLEAAKIVFLP
jgi:membrane-associated PAP2 superfamily phosphatase